MKHDPIKREKRRALLHKILFWFVFVSLVGSLVSTLIVFFNAPVKLADGETGRVRSDYTLMLFQGVFGLVALFFPSMLERRLKLELPSFMQILYIIFLYCAIYLGELSDFFYKVPNWDVFLHACSGFMMGAVGFTIIDSLNNHRQVKVELSPFFVALFSFCFALTIGTLWEIFEFASDGILGVNMQKFALEDGTLLIGRRALTDTMKDLIVDSISAFTMCVIGYIVLKNSHRQADGDEKPQAGAI